MLDDDGEEARGSEDRSRTGGEAGEEEHCGVGWEAVEWVVTGGVVVNGLSMDCGG